MSNRANLELELFELRAANDKATSWGAAVGARSERINEIERELRRMDEARDHAPAAPTPELDEDDPVVLAVARGIAEHGFARPWDDFLPLNVHDTDQSDLIDYAKAAIAAMPARSAASTVEPVADQFERIIASLNYDGDDLNSLTVGEIRRAL